MDGMHRVVKANLLELKTIKAYRLSTLPKPDYIDIDPNDLPLSNRVYHVRQSATQSINQLKVLLEINDEVS